jgi:hypothetical protein
LPNKNGETIAQAVPGISEQRVPEFLTHMPWDEADRNQQRVQTMMAEATTDAGVVVCDATGFPTQGKASVGVARPDAGPLGQVDNGQVAVTCGDTAPQAMWPVAARLSGPTPWALEPARRPQARGPAAVSGQTTLALALPRLDQARAWGGPQRGGVADADDGANPNVWAGLAARPERSVVAVRTAALLQRVPRGPWRTMR